MFAGVSWAAAILPAFLKDCWNVFWRLSAPVPRDAIKQLGLILAASAVLIVVVTTIDSTSLYLYALIARRVAG
jgi:hypothetical protein